MKDLAKNVVFYFTLLVTLFFTYYLFFFFELFFSDFTISKFILAVSIAIFFWSAFKRSNGEKFLHLTLAAAIGYFFAVLGVF